jgi:hypothetical protein
MDAILATIVAGREALIQINIEVNKFILKSTLIFVNLVAVGLLAPSQRYSTIEEEEAC